MEVLPKITTRRWRVSVLSELTHDRAVVTSMLNLLQSSVGERWRFVEPEHADFLLLGTSMTPPTTTRGITPLIARFVDAGQTEFAGAAFSVQRPLRAMPFLELLSDADARLRELMADWRSASRAFSKHSDGLSQPDTAHQTFHGLSSTSEQSTNFMALATHEPDRASPSGLRPVNTLGWILHGLRKTGTTTEALALMSRDGSELAAVSAGRAAFSSPHALPDLLLLIDSGFRRAEIRTAEFWAQSSVSHQAQPLDLLCWHVGKLMAIQSGLAPWLNRDQSYRLISWPDFGTIGAERTGFKLAASMAQRSFTIAQVSAATEIPEDQVTSFLNSASLCGLLVAGLNVHPGDSAVKVAEAQPEKRSMLARLRSRLGL